MPNNRNMYSFIDLKADVPRWFRARPRITALVLVSLVIFPVLAIYRVNQLSEALSPSTDDLALFGDLTFIIVKLQLISTFSDVINQMESLGHVVQTIRIVGMVLLLLGLVAFCVWFEAKDRPARRSRHLRYKN